jgi:NADH dehydrogenase FAD-containing subunit
MNPFTERLSNLLPNQFHKRAIEVDAHLRVKGAPLGSVYAIGDCATVGFWYFCVGGKQFC